MRYHLCFFTTHLLFSLPTPSSSVLPFHHSSCYIPILLFLQHLALFFLATAPTFPWIAISLLFSSLSFVFIPSLHSPSLLFLAVSSLSDRWNPFPVRQPGGVSGALQRQQWVRLYPRSQHGPGQNAASHLLHRRPVQTHPGSHRARHRTCKHLWLLF